MSTVNAFLLRAGVVVVLVFQLVLGAAQPSLAAFTSTTGNGSNALAAASSFYRAVVMADTPVAYWRLGESGSTATDQMGTSNGGYGGAVTQGVGGALVNDSNFAIDTFGGGMGVADTAALRQPTANVTIEAWVRPDTLAVTQFIVNKGLDYFLYIETGQLKFGVRTVPANYWAVATSTLTVGAWQHVVGTYDGAQLRVFRNGTQVGIAAASGTLTTVGGNLIIGAFDANGSTWYDGRVDEVAIYAGVLTPSKVVNHYARGATTQ
jgi:hypothetical protein